MAYEDDAEYVTTFKVAADAADDIGRVYIASCETIASEVEKIAREGERVELLGDPRGRVIENYRTEQEETFVMVEVEVLNRLDD